MSVFLETCFKTLIALLSHLRLLNLEVSSKYRSILLPTVKLNGVSKPISIEYKMVHGLNQAAFKT